MARGLHSALGLLGAIGCLVIDRSGQQLRHSHQRTPCPFGFGPYKVLAGFKAPADCWLKIQFDKDCNLWNCVLYNMHSDMCFLSFNWVHVIVIYSCAEKCNVVLLWFLLNAKNVKN